MTSCKDVHSTDLLKEEWKWTNKLGSSQKSKLRVLGLGAGHFGWKEVTDSKGYVDNRTRIQAGANFGGGWKVEFP